MCLPGGVNGSRMTNIVKMERRSGRKCAIDDVLLNGRANREGGKRQFQPAQQGYVHTYENFLQLTKSQAWHTDKYNLSLCKNVEVSTHHMNGICTREERSTEFIYRANMNSLLS